MKLKAQLQAKEQDEDDDEDEKGRKVPPKQRKRKGIRVGAQQGRKNEPPANSLTLEFVHGLAYSIFSHFSSPLFLYSHSLSVFLFSYRGYDCRNNLHYTSSGDMVYHVAGLGIVYSKATHQQRYYSAHTDDILCLALHPKKSLVATGQIGRDPTVHVWNVETMETMSILQGQHSRGVCAVDFSS